MYIRHPKLAELKDAVGSADSGNTLETALNYRKNVVKAMEAARVVIGEVEPTVPAGVWPVPVYADMLFKV